MTSQNPSPIDIIEFDLSPIEGSTSSDKVLGYNVHSTATINVEDNPVLPTESVKAKLRGIAQYLVETNAPEVVIAIHGYSTQEADAWKWYKKIYTFANTICEPKTSVFLGYRWPSENPKGDPATPEDGNFSAKVKSAFQSLPILPRGIMGGSLFLIVILSGLLLITHWLNAWLTPLLILSTFTFATLFALVLLRLVTYFRDNYRAANYAVLDLVELIRQLDQAIFDLQSAQTDHSPRRINLSFIGHSMGCFVVTNTIRILSDVFDSSSINQNPPAEIGRVFCLERLVLVAPDIPAEAIRTGRANFLKSSLRRCEEAYVFSNEADLALRLASTAANYFSFPGKTRSSGYRLGNLTVKHFENEGDRTKRFLSEQNYGIVNLQDANQQVCVETPYQWMEIRSSDHEHQKLIEVQHLQKLSKAQELKEPSTSIHSMQDIPISDLFTYFDCTDYVDFQDDQPKAAARGLVSFARRKSALNLKDYLELTLAYFLGFPRSINVHGGYFNGLLSQEMIYKLAFVGFQGLLKTSQSEQSETLTTSTSAPDINLKLLREFSQKCQEKGIQIVLAPIRYQKDVLGEKQFNLQSYEAIVCDTEHALM